MTAKMLLKIAGGVIVVLLSVCGFLLVEDRGSAIAQIKTVDENVKKVGAKADAAFDSVKAIRNDMDKKQIRDSAWQASMDQANYRMQRQMVEIAAAVGAAIVVTPKKPDSALTDTNRRLGP